MKKYFVAFLLIISVSCKKNQQLTSIFNWCNDSLCFVGDSQFAESGGDLVPPPRRYWQELGKDPATVLNCSKGGASSGQIADSFEVRKGFFHTPIVVMAGTNDNWHDDDIIRNLHRIVDGNPKFLICEVQSGSWERAWKGTVQYSHDSALHVHIEQEFGTEHFVKIKAALQKLADGSAGDSLDLVHDVVPRSCLYDWIHEDWIHKNNKGHEGILQAILSKLQPCQAN